MEFYGKSFPEAVQLLTGESGEGQRSEEHTSELQSRLHLVCRLLLEKKNFFNDTATTEIYTLSIHVALTIYGTKCSGLCKATRTDKKV